MRIWNKITGEPWAITETALQTILQIAERKNEAPEAVAAKLGRELRNTHTVIERDGVAIIPVVGPLFRYANLFTQISGASSYEILAKDFTTALENPDIHAIILDIDSPGGEVNGVAELAGMIVQARGKKPIIAYASGDAASGAYWIASAADEIIASPTSALGSIGVVGMFSGKNDGDAVQIVSSQSPHKRLDLTTDEGRAKLQTRIDAMAQVFVESVARNRGVDPPTVIQNFGGGDVFIGASAVAAGLADRLGSLERLIVELSPQTKAPQESFLTLCSEQKTGRNHCNLEVQNKQHTKNSLQISQTKTKENPPMDTEPLTLEKLEQDNPDLAVSLRLNGAKTERERIKGILSCDAATGRENLAREIALTTEISPIEAQQLLSHASMEQTEPSNVTPFEQAMASVPNPEVLPDGDDEDENHNMATVADRIASY